MDESTPAGVVQRYSTAVIAGDESAAAAYLTEDVRADCNQLEHFGGTNITVTLVSTKERSDSADVAVSIVSSVGNGPFGAPESQYEDVFGLVLRGRHVGGIARHLREQPAIRSLELGGRQLAPSDRRDRIGVGQRLALAPADGGAQGARAAFHCLR